MYELADETAKSLRTEIIKSFRKTKERIYNLPPSTIDQIHLLYERILDLSVKAYMSLAEEAYGGEITEAWILGILDDYDPVVKYVFINEIERKGERLAEAVISSAKENSTVNTPAVKKEFSKGLSYVTWQTDVFTITVEGAARIRAMKEAGVEKVVWHTSEDEHVCEECEKRNKVVYPINAIPPKPHPNCRCYVTAF